MSGESEFAANAGLDLASREVPAWQKPAPKRGRPPLAPDARSVQRAIRLTPAQWIKLDLLGGLGWLRDLIDIARVTPEE